MGLFSTKDSDSNNELAFDFHFPSSKKALLIFIRNPELGKVKTRLSKTIGDDAALTIYTYLLQHTTTITESVKADKFVFYSEKIKKNDFWDNSIFRKKLQEGKNLGNRMENAFTELFLLGYEKAVIVGSDLFDLQAEHIENAFISLDNHDVVIGPAKDGGYYLLGMKRLHKRVFQNKKWGTETVRKNTLQDLQNESVFLLEELNDIDIYDDMKDNSTLKNLIKK